MLVTVEMRVVVRVAVLMAEDVEVSVSVAVKVFVALFVFEGDDVGVLLAAGVAVDVLVRVRGGVEDG